MADNTVHNQYVWNLGTIAHCLRMKWHEIVCKHYTLCGTLHYTSNPKAYICMFKKFLPVCIRIVKVILFVGDGLPIVFKIH